MLFSLRLEINLPYSHKCISVVYEHIPQYWFMQLTVYKQVFLILVIITTFILFQFYIVKENRGNEGTCVGVSRWPVHDFNHRTTSDMWLYRAYSGNLYHNGEQTLTLSSFTQGDFITCVLDMEARTISFGKNGEVLKLIHKLYMFSCFYLYSTQLFKCWLPRL